MKKTVLAFAVAAAVVVPAVAAADTALYGRMNVSLDAVDDGQESSGQLASNSSRLGVRGSEDLGFAGLKGVYQIEARLNGGNDQSRTFNGSDLTGRNTFLGLAGDFGELRLGKHDTAYKMATLRLNFFADTLGDMHALAGQFNVQNDPSITGVDGTTFGANFYSREDNTIVYMSPNFDGLQFMGHYTTDRISDRPGERANDQDSMSLAATFEQGPMFVTVAFEQRNEWLDQNFDENDPNYADGTAWKVGGTYQIQDLTLAAMFENIDSDVEGLGDRDLFHLGAKYQLGQAYVMGSFTSADDNDEDNTAADMWALGAGYDFTKRTGMYATYAQVSNDDNAGYGFGGGKGKPVAPAISNNATEDVSGFQVGVTHNF
ncbi:MULTISPECIES: porin [unclassified Ectothiorhodospira]|uniref:porin n=1 Tax=unclassified Ectothiorhodospira TaxID=2684909 RepID=UPI001EE7E1D1|nr:MULTISPECIES: porin [unclassified Ectothiorhodospira]MCG5516848.1 porin [Ectothiorhodospira sp. 9100]MCG5519910.1 porin [Ectothiorhodospira sp. 9905]